MALTLQSAKVVLVSMVETLVNFMTKKGIPKVICNTKISKIGCANGPIFAAETLTSLVFDYRHGSRLEAESRMKFSSIVTVTDFRSSSLMA